MPGAQQLLQLGNGAAEGRAGLGPPHLERGAGVLCQPHPRACTAGQLTLGSAGHVQHCRSCGWHRWEELSAGREQDALTC